MQIKTLFLGLAVSLVLAAAMAARRLFRDDRFAMGVLMAITLPVSAYLAYIGLRVTLP